jgi:GDP-L-fucose synthase
MTPDARIFIAGSQGLVGSAVVRALRREGFSRLLTPPRAELDLRDAQGVQRFFEREKPEYVVLAAAKVGGIHANSTYPADFILDNLAIQNHVVESAWRTGTKKLVFLGSSCIYPRLAEQPIREEALLTGPLEPTNEPYAIAKIAGIKLCQALRRQYGFDAISLMPTNLYGPGDNFHPQNSHVLPALLHRFHLAKQAGDPRVVIWGTGAPKREFLHVDDMAEATVFLMKHYSGEDIVNVGTGEDVSILELATLIREVVGYPGEIVGDTTRPDGTPRKLLDVSRLHALGWKHRIGLEEGVRSTYAWYLENASRLRV